jgi:hypothetical protein
MKVTIPEPVLNGHRASMSGEQHLFAMRVRSSDGSSEYLVRLLPGGQWTCECRGYHYRSTCRHVDTAKTHLLELACYG